MEQKLPSAITQIQLNRHTFENTGTVIEPTFINFFFGRNGAGKSTLAEAIVLNENITWQSGVSHSDYDVLVYNQDFIDRNFSTYGDLAGVITIHEQNIEAQQRLADRKATKAAAKARITQLEGDIESKKGERDALIAAFQEMCWKRTKGVRETLKEALKGFLKSAQFADLLLATTPVEHDFEELRSLCEVAFSLDSRPYHVFGRVDTAPTYGTLPGRELLDKAIVSSSTTPFAQFIKALNATDWVRQGHNLFDGHTSGKCPYCQQTLPTSFEADLASCFDAQYQQDVDELREFAETYRRETAAIIEKLRGNMVDVLPSVDLTEYKEKLDLLESKIEINRQRIASKIKEPTIIISLEDTDSILIDLGQIIDDINRQIMTNNSIVNDKRTKQNLCKKQAPEYLAFLLSAEIVAHNAALEKIKTELEALDVALRAAKTDLSIATREIQALNRLGVNTEEAITSINNLLRDSGFQGFRLEPKKGAKHTYEVIRPNGNRATRLSEGERNFIAFLYFYQLVKGNGKAVATETETDETPAGADTRDKIVVIDDPVSSMDSNALFIVSSIVRGMIAVCYNNTEYRNPEIEGDNIKQIFIMTHNAYFHNEITYKEVPHYRSTSFYVVRKIDNISSIIHCVRPRVDAIDEKENYNPVQNTYAALWSELRQLYSENHASIAIKNVSRRIIDQYFLQLCGFDGSDIRRIVLETNKAEFITTSEDGKPNYDQYILAKSLLHYISSPSGIGDEIFIDDECMDAETHKAAFCKIFTVMGQDQHYKMMMNAN